VTRLNLVEAAYQKVGLFRAESAEMVEQVLAEISDTLVAGEPVKLSSFGVFTVLSKNKRVGRNPRTRELVPIEPRQVLVFRSSPVLRAPSTVRTRDREQR
jgi:integration host factor subunit alpha